MVSPAAWFMLPWLKDGRVHDLTCIVRPGLPNSDQVLGEVAAMVRKDENFVLLSGSEFIWKPGWVADHRARREALEAAMGWS
jgi:hypothetical protein